MCLSVDWVMAIGTWFSGIVVAASLWFLWIQIRYLRHSLTGSIYQNVYETMIKMDNVFVENPELKPYFYDGKETNPADPLYQRVSSVAEMLTDYFDSVYYQKNYVPVQWFREFTSFMRDIYKSSPALREHLSQRQQWHPKEFIMYIEAER